MMDRRVVARAHALTKTFGDHTSEPVRAVREVDLELRAGDVTLITGSSGSGKTTLLSLIGGLIPPTSGDVELAGERLGGLSQRDLTDLRLHAVGYVFQAFRLINALSVVENVEIVLNLSGMRRPASHARAVQLLDQFGLTGRLDSSPATLSAGEKQRVAIARAMANDPPLILADEPTGSLDSRAGMLAIDALREAAHTQGRSVLIVSHDPRIHNHADRRLQMEDGRLGEETVMHHSTIPTAYQGAL